MWKRAVFYALIAAVIALFTYNIYSENAPNTMKVSNQPIQYNTVPLFTYKTIDAEIKNHDGALTVVFFNSEDSNSIYLFNVILNEVLNTHNLQMLNNVVYCDLRDMKTSEITETKNRWGFYEYPAIVHMEYKNNLIQINSSIEWSSGSNLTYEAVNNWLLNNKIIPK